MPNWKKVIVSGSNAILNNITASGNISSSGLLYASLSYDNTSVTDGVVAYDTATGQLYYTGSYGNSGEDTDWYINDGALGTNNDFITSSQLVKVAHQGLIANSGSVSSTWGLNNHYKNTLVGFSGNGTYESSTTTTPGGYTGKIVKAPRTYVTAEAWDIPETRIYPVSLTARGTGSGNFGLNEGYPYNYLVFGQSFYYEFTSGSGPGGGGPSDEPQEDTGLGGQLVIDGGLILQNDIRKFSLSSSSGSLPPLTGSGEAPPAVVIRPQGGIFFFETGSTLSSSGSYLATSASARIVYNTSSRHLSIKVGSKQADDLTEVMYISKSGDNPRIGIGVTNPLTNFDFKDISDSRNGTKLILRTSRPTKGGETGDEAGKINFAIDSSSYGDIQTSGSIAKILGSVTSISEQGASGKLSFEVADDNDVKQDTTEVFHLQKNPGGTVDLTYTVGVFQGSVNLNGSNSSLYAGKDVQAGGNITTTTGYVKADSLRIGTTQDPGGDSAIIAGDLILNNDFTSSGDISSSGDIIANNGSFSGNLTVQGDITAENYIVSSSVTYMTQSFSSGSTIFGDSSDDTHQFTGSVDITGSLDVRDGNILITSGNFQVDTFGEGIQWNNGSGNYGLNEIRLSSAQNMQLVCGGVFQFYRTMQLLAGNTVRWNNPDNSDYIYIDNSAATGLARLDISDSSNNELISISSSGNVGIGTTTPDKLLVVSGVGAEIVIDDTDSTDTPSLRFRESGTTSGIITTDASEMIFKYGTTEAMRIDSSGNVGIGTTSPGPKLHTVGAGYFTGQTVLSQSLSLDYDYNNVGLIIDEEDYIYTKDGTSLRKLIGKTSDIIEIGQSSTALIDGIKLLPGTSNGYVSFYDNTTEYARFQSGSLGIGTITPPEKLTVEGNISASGDLTFNGDPTIGTNDNSSLTIEPQGTLFLGNGSQTDLVKIGRESGGPAGRVEIHANSATIAAKFESSTITFNHHITASSNISASGTIVGSNLSGTNTGDQDLSSYSTITQLNVSSSALQSNIDTNTSNISSIASFTASLDPDITTLSLPASTTISTFGASLISASAATNARTTLGLGSIATTAIGDYVNINGDILEGDLDFDSSNNYNIINVGNLYANTISGSTFVSDGVTVVSTPDAETVKIGQSAGGTGPMKVSIVSDNTQYGLFSSTGIQLTGSVDITGSVTISNTLSIPGFADVSASLAAAGTVDTTGTPANNHIARFTDSNTLKGSNDFTFDGSDMVIDAINSVIVNASNNDAYFQVKGSSDNNLLQVNPQLNDRVGIGTSTPSQKLTVEGNISASGDITTNTISTISTTLASDSATNVDTFNTSSYTGAIYDYILIDTTVGARAGQFMIAQDSGSVTFTDNSTRHLFDGTAPEISGQINGANVEVQVTNGNGYTFKSFVKKL